MSMMILTIADAVVSKGYNGAPTIHYFSENRGAGFRIGCKKYDKYAENNTRWVNLNVIVPEEMTEKLRRMQLQAYAHINITGAFDMRPGTDKETGETRTWPTIYALELTYASGTNTAMGEAGTVKEPEKQKGEPVTPDQIPGFIGFVPLEGSNPYFGK